MKRLIIASLLLAQSVLGTILINETFEGAGTPSGWYGAGGANYVYSAVPLDGLQSMRCTAGNFGLYLSGGALNNSEIWFSLLFKAETLPAGPVEVIQIYDPTQTTAVYSIVLNPTGTLEVDPSTGGTHATAAAISTGTIYNIWGHYKAVTAGTSILELSFDTVGNPRPSSGSKYVTATDGVSANNAGMIFFSYTSVTIAEVFDDVQVADTDAFAGGGATPTPTPMGSNRFFLFPQ